MLNSALFATISLPQDAMTNVQMLLRWAHFLAGITWIGLLYFFNLVNVDFMKSLDAATKSKVVPQLMSRALWWFRWGAVATVLSGLLYYIIILSSEPDFGAAFLTWLALAAAAYVVMFACLQQTAGPLSKGPTLAWVFAVLVLVFAALVVKLNGRPLASTRSISIGIGGGIGLFMLLNVWGIIWPAQKRIIQWTKDAAEKGTPTPPEMPQLARKAFLASRTNAWLSIPMLFFMAAASHYPMFDFKDRIIDLPALEFQTPN